MIRKNKKQLEVKGRKALSCFCWLMLSIGFGIAAPFVYKNGLDQIHTEEGVAKAILLTFFSFIGFCAVGGLAVLLLYDGLELFIKRKTARKVRKLFPQFSFKICLEMLQKCSRKARSRFSYDDEFLYEKFKSCYEDAAFDMAIEEISRIESHKKIQEFIAKKKKIVKKLPETLKKTCEIISEKKRTVQGLPEHFLQEREKRKIQELKEMKEQEKADIERMEKYLEKNSIDLRLDLRKEAENEKL